MADMPLSPPVVPRWTRRLDGFAPEFFAATPALRPLVGRCAILLHGSTCLGVDDAFSDLDVWVLAPEPLVRQAEATAGTRFFTFGLDDKAGHFNLETMDEMADRVRRCDLERIAELRRCCILSDVDSRAANMKWSARCPMREPVRRAWFCHHYVDMRAAHRNADHPLERGDPLALLQCLVPTLDHALRAAMVLDGEPYPYVKWLGRAAAGTSTGSRVVPLVNDIVDQLSAGALRHPGPEAQHPLGQKLREIRRVLVDGATAGGIDETWLDRWWVHLTQARAGVGSVEW